VASEVCGLSMYREDGDGEEECLYTKMMQSRQDQAS